MTNISYAKFEQKYKLENVIGHGSFGKVIKIRKNKTNELYALKKLKLTKYQQIKDAFQEIQILKTLKHPLVVQMYEYYSVQIKKSVFFKHYQHAMEIGIILQLAHISLQHAIKNRIEIYSEENIWNFAVQFIGLFAQLEKSKIVHRDIKPANILIFGPHLNCKLADFGLCKKITNYDGGIAGSYHYSSPKLRIKLKDPQSKVKSNAIKDDVYSFGVTLLEIVTGHIGAQYDFERTFKETKKICKNIQRIPKLLQYLLQYQEEKRPTFQQLVKLIKGWNYHLSTKQRKLEIQNIKYQQIKQPQTQIKKMQIVQCNQYDDHQNKQIFSQEIQYLNQHQPAKTQKVHNKPIKQQIIPIKGSIQSISCINQIVICGLDDGQMKILKNRSQVIHIKLHKLQIQNIKKNPFIIHRNFISVLEIDSHGDLWSAGADNYLIIWQKKLIMETIKQRIQLQQFYQSNLFKNPQSLQSQILKIINIKQNEITKIQLPFNHKSGVSALFCQDRDNFVVGYYDGYVYCLWNKEQIHCKLHSGTITCIKIVNGILLTSGSDGSLKMMNLQKSNFFQSIHQLQKPIIYFEADYDIQNKNNTSANVIGLIDINGKKQLITQDGQIIYQQQSNLRNVLTSKQIMGNIYILSEDGKIMKGSDQIINLQGKSKGWNCISIFNSHGIVIGSYQNQIAICQW